MRVYQFRHIRADAHCSPRLAAAAITDVAAARARIRSDALTAERARASNYDGRCAGSPGRGVRCGIRGRRRAGERRLAGRGDRRARRAVAARRRSRAAARSRRPCAASASTSRGPLSDGYLAGVEARSRTRSRAGSAPRSRGATVRWRYRITLERAGRRRSRPGKVAALRHVPGVARVDAQRRLRLERGVEPRRREGVAPLGLRLLDGRQRREDRRSSTTASTRRTRTSRAPGFTMPAGYPRGQKRVHDRRR